MKDFYKDRFMGRVSAAEFTAAMDRVKAAEFLTAMGLKTNVAKLALLACRGGGPIYFKFGHRAFYREKDLLSWVENRLGTPAATYSQHLANQVA